MVVFFPVYVLAAIKSDEIYTIIALITIVLGLIISVISAEIGVFPFSGRRMLKNKNISYYIANGFPIMMLTLVVIDEPALSWYPSDSGYWGGVPMLVYAFYSMLFKKEKTFKWY